MTGVLDTSIVSLTDTYEQHTPGELQTKRIEQNQCVDEAYPGFCRK